MGVMVGSIFVFAGCSASTDKSKTATSETKTAEVVKSKMKQIEKNVEKILAEKDKDTKLSEYKKFVTESSALTLSQIKRRKKLLIPIQNLLRRSKQILKNKTIKT
ncbi:hypothetical protein P6Z32_11905 [Enterococcus faecium]|nr:hypothetical protein [Enterococcus faecium]